MSNAVPHEPKVEPPVGTRDSSDREHLSILSSQTAIPCRLGPADSYAEIEYHKTRPLPSGVQHMDKDEVKEVKPYSEAVLSERGSVGDNLARIEHKLWLSGLDIDSFVVQIMLDLGAQNSQNP
ncbi:hypothetical protein E4U28_002938 [Claviceps purpurea]|nr:hypothetical protein E4U28_002938 [Claviceps purpurea]